MHRDGTDGTKTSRGGVVYQDLRNEILSGSRAPGERLRLAPLGKHYGVAMSVVREALTRLAGEGLVDAAPHTGFSVINLSKEQLEDLTDVRVAIEGLALEWSIAKGDAQWESDVIAAHHLLSATPRYQSESESLVSDDWASAHWKFHYALVSACGSSRLLSIRSTLYESAEIYRRWSAPAAGCGRDVAAEHAALMASAVDRETETCKRLLEEHIRRTTTILLQRLAT